MTALFTALFLAIASLLRLGDGHPSRVPDPVAFALSTPFTNAEAGTIAALKAVYLFGAGTVKLATNDGTEAQATVIGLAFAAITAGSVGLILTIAGQRISGFPPATFTADAPVFLGTNGDLTSVAPSSGFITPVGFADTTTSLIFNPRQPFGV